MALAGGSSAALHNVLIGPSRVRSESIRPRYVKAGQGMTNNLQSGMNFFLSIEKRKSTILESQKFFEYTFSQTPAKRGSG